MNKSPMDKSMAIGVVLGAAIATVGVVFAGYQIVKDDEPAATVTVTHPELAATPTPPECVPTEPRDEHRIAGTVAGAVVGGAVGRDVGDRDVTTAAGAAAGAYAGNQIQKKFQEERSDC